MSDCLVTKLKGVVSDPSLPILGACRIKFQVTSATMGGLYIGFRDAVEITTDKSVTILNASKVQEYPSGTSFTIGSGAHFIKPDALNQFVIVTIYNKHIINVIGTASVTEANGIELLADCTFLSALTQIWTNSGGKLNLNLLKNAPLLNTIYSANLAEISGDIGSLAGRTINTIAISSANSTAIGDVGELTFKSDISSILINGAIGITGNLTDFYGYPLSVLSLQRTGVSGSLEEFLEQWYGLNKTSIALWLGINITFNGTSISQSGDFYGTATKSNGVITLKNANDVVLGTYDGNSWTYA
jgi:hypothetical protein